MTIEAIRRWISLVQCARKLPASKWETWTFIVSAASDIEDKTRLGQAALSTFGRHWTYTTVEAPHVDS